MWHWTIIIRKAIGHLSVSLNRYEKWAWWANFTHVDETQQW